MRVLTFNAGSSSLKFRLGDSATGDAPLLRGMVSSLDQDAQLICHQGDQKTQVAVEARDHAQAVERIFELLEDRARWGESLLDGIDLVGHRVVDGGETFYQPVSINDAVLAELEAISTLAPLHNPPALAVIYACRMRLRDAAMVAVFDTAFFHTLPEPARNYALPADWRQAHGIRRYGFHGIAHRHMVEAYRRLSGNTGSAKVISFQLGHGCSAAASLDGRAVDTSMGFTPLSGLVMATRAGDLDPGILLHLAAQGLSWQTLHHGLHHASGLLALSGVSGDMRKLLQLETEGHAGARLSVDSFCHHARRYLGAYLAVLGGADAIVFGGGIGEHAPSIRARICANMNWCGLRLDEPANRAAIGKESRITAAGSAIEAYVIPVDEEALIAREACFAQTAVA